jgi:chemotaxis protein MotB
MADECPKCPPVGAPAWLATFADMMSLLMCFFVLLLSSATQDARKFKQVAGAMRDAFGVQREMFATEQPMGTSVIAEHFSPGKPDPTVLDEIKQSTTQESPTLGVDIDTLKKQVMEAALDEVAAEAEKMRRLLKDEIEQGLVTVETQGLQIIMRIEEKGSFPSGSADLKPGFEAVMDKITTSVKEAKGNVRIAGHTDDIPINTSHYRSNWELSSSRAVTVAQYMLNNGGVESGRVAVEGYADTKPLAPNDSVENRAKNRRVEIVLIQEDPTLALDQSKAVSGTE